MNQDNNRFLKRLIVLYTSFIFIVLFMGGYLYSISIENVSNEIRTQTKISLDKTIHDLDVSFRTMDLLAGQLVSYSNLVQIANTTSEPDNDFYYKAYHTINDLSVYIFTESTLPIKTHYVYLNNPDYIISLSQFTSTDLYYKSSGGYKDDMYDSWHNLLNSKDKYRQFIPLDPFKTFNDSTYLYMLPLTEYTIKNVPASLCFEIDYQQINAIFRDLKFYEEGYLLVLDQYGHVAFTLNANGNLTFGTDELKSLKYNESFAKIKDHGHNLFITKGISDYNDWKYYLVQPTDASLYSLSRYRNFFILVIGIALFFEILMIAILSRSNFRKIMELGTELLVTQTEQQLLQQLVDKQKPIIKQSYLRRIMEGNISTPEELDYAGQYVNINLDSEKYAVLHLVTYMNQYEIYDENSAVTVPDNIDFQVIIRDAILEYFNNSLFISDSEDREYSILVSSTDTEDSLISSKNIHKSFKQLHQYLKEEYSIWTFAGLGNWNSSLMNTWNSYQQSIQAVSYATKRNIFCCYFNLEKDTGTFYYPIELTKQLCNFVTTGNKSQVLEIFEIIRHENMEVRSLPIHVMKYLLSDIRNTLYKIRFTIKPTEDNENDLTVFDSQIDEHMTLKLCEDLALKLCELYENVTSSHKQISIIKQYIIDNYKDPSLCLNKISDEFDISESYFSYLFKEETGENFSSYLGRIRMEHAWKMLKETNISICELYDKIGYNNSHTFRRVFKKIYGMSPKEARNMK